MSTSGNIIINGALELIGVKDPDGTAGGAMLTTGLRRFNMMIGQLNLQVLTSPLDIREVFPVVAGKGGTGAVGSPTGPYTIGPGGDFNTSRPEVLTAAGLLMGATTFPNQVEIPRAVLTQDDYNAIQVKDLPNSMFTGVYFNAGYAGGLATIQLWPIPNTTINSLVLYRRSLLATITNSTATYDLPPGADEMLEYQLAIRLAPTYHVALDSIPDVTRIASQSLKNFKLSNVQMADMRNDAPFSMDARAGYNIDTGTGG